MRLEGFITATQFCTSHNISRTLVVALREHGLVTIVEKQEILYIPVEELSKAEKIIRLHTDLEINLEGVEVITQLLERMVEMQDETQKLRNRLRLYE